jgi:hypothetical protein
MEVGQFVKVSAPGRGAATAEVIHLATPAQLPEFPALSVDLPPDLHNRTVHAALLAILHEWRVQRLAWLAYDQRPGSRVVFVALDVDGQWADLRRQRLTIEEV